MPFNTTKRPLLDRVEVKSGSSQDIVELGGDSIGDDDDGQADPSIDQGLFGPFHAAHIAFGAHVEISAPNGKRRGDNDADRRANTRQPVKNSSDGSLH